MKNHYPGLFKQPAAHNADVLTREPTGHRMRTCARRGRRATLGTRPPAERCVHPALHDALRWQCAARRKVHGVQR